MVIEVAVMPGADAVSGALALPLVLADGLGPPAVLAVELPVAEAGAPELELEPDEQAATASAAAATTARAGARSRGDLFIEYLLSRVWHPAGPPSARFGRMRFRRGRAASAPRPGFPAGTGA